MAEKRLSTWVRWIHVYLSLAAFGVTFFFAVTGLTLNHAEWFEGLEVTREERGVVDARLVDPALPAEQLDRLALVEALRARHALRGTLTEILVDERECNLGFKAPGYAADIVVDRETASYTLYIAQRGAIAVFDDLHKGRHAGALWSWVIDISAVALAFASASGIWLVCYVKRWRRPGLILAALGLVAAVVVGLLALR